MLPALTESSEEHRTSLKKGDSEGRRGSVTFHERVSRRMSTMLKPPTGRRSSRIMGVLHDLTTSRHDSLHDNEKYSEQAQLFWEKNRRMGDDSLSALLSALYAKILVILGIALPITEILNSKIPINVYQGFYVYLYVTSTVFVIFVNSIHIKTKSVSSLVMAFHEKTGAVSVKKKTKFGSFYLRLGAISFGIGAMVYSCLEFGQYFEIDQNADCRNILIALTPAARGVFSIVQMQFIFLNTSEMEMARHKVIARFGLMHMVAANICEWLYILVEETKHEIHHLADSHTPEKLTHTIAALIDSTTEPVNILIPNFNSTENSTVTHEMAKHYAECFRTNIMGTLVQNASPFLFPCTIEYSLICAVILYEMWKKVKSLEDINRTRRNSQKTCNAKSVHHMSIDCTKAHQGLFGGILLVVLTIICMIMYFVLHDQPNYKELATTEVTICEIILYSVTTLAVVAAIIKMRDLKFQKHAGEHSSSTELDCTLLVLGQTGIYLYGMFSIIGSYYTLDEVVAGGKEALAAELICLIQTSVQTLFILNACWRKCRGADQHRRKPGKEIITFLLVANMAMWFINTLIKGRAGFRPTHLDFYGTWAWTVITHVSMPLAIFYRFHATTCLFEIWKSAYKAKKE